jgi:glutamate racemase
LITPAADAYQATAAVTNLVDPATEVVMKLTDILKPDGHAGKRPQSLFFASGPVTSFYTAGREFLGSFPFTVEQVSINSQGTAIDKRESTNRGTIST